MTVGMGIDPGIIRIDAAWIALSVVGLLVIKTLLIAMLGRWFGLSRGTAVEVGLMLSQAGEFAFVIIGTATARQDHHAAIRSVFVCRDGLIDDHHAAGVFVCTQHRHVAGSQTA